MIVAASFFFVRPGWYLTLQNGTTGETIARFPMDDSLSFSVGFIHSVNKTPFIDVYRLVDDQLFLQESIYYGYGAGVETSFTADQTLETLDDGAMVLGNLNTPIPDPGPTYIVGTVSDHTLIVGDILSDYSATRDYVGVFSDALPIATPEGLSVIGLSDLCGRHTKVTFVCEYRLF